MLTILLLILILFIPSFYISVKKDISIERVIPCTIISIVLIIYIFGLINLLKFGVYFVFTLFILFVVLLIVDFITRKIRCETFIKVIIKPSICIWIIWIIGLFIYYKGRMIVSWDEFSHWGDVVKMMYYNNIYNTNPASLSVARAYPPVMSIFQYFVENLSFSGFKEHYLYCAYQVFVISLIIPFIKDIRWKEIFKIILILMIVLLAPTVFFDHSYYCYNIIYIDPFLGILFGYVMACIFVTKEYDRFSIVSISLTLFALTLTKDIAPVFSFISIVFVFLHIVIVQENYKLIKSLNKESLLTFLKKVKPLLIFFAVIILSYLSWKINVRINVTQISGENASSFVDVFKALFHIENTYRITVINNYISTLSSYRFTDMGSIYTITFVMIMFSILLYKFETGSDKKKSLFGFYTIYIGEIFYVFLMLVLYILLFSEYEAINLSSFERYIGIYLTAILYFIILITIYQCITQKKYLNILLLLLIVVLNANMSNTLSNLINYKKNNYKTQEFRKKYIETANNIRKNVKNGEKYKFYIIVQNSTGAEKWMLRYEIRDILKEMNEGFNWSLGEKYSEGDIWTLNISKGEFKKILFKENYDYVYLFNIDDKFVDRYGSIFNYNNLESGQLYKVNKDKNTVEFVN